MRMKIKLIVLGVLIVFGCSEFSSSPSKVEVELAQGYTYTSIGLLR